MTNKNRSPSSDTMNCVPSWVIKPEGCVLIGVSGRTNGNTTWSSRLAGADAEPVGGLARGVDEPAHRV
jgi:hypothetical protein